jgi:hypothetical protein
MRKEREKVLVAKSLSCRKMASILGQIRSNITTLLFLRVFTDTLKVFSDLHHPLGWDHQVVIPGALKEQIKALKPLLLEENGRPFLATPTLCSDSSTKGWGGLDLQSGKRLHNFWRSQLGWHINLKELSAAKDTILSLAQPGESILIQVDNQVAASYLRKQGGRKTHLNDIIRPLLVWAVQKKVQIKVEWVPSAEMKAESLSRW